MGDTYRSIGTHTNPPDDDDDDFSTIAAWESATDGGAISTGNREFGLLRGEAHTSAAALLFSGVTAADSSTYRWLSTLDERHPTLGETAVHNFDHTDISGARIIRSNHGTVIDVNDDFIRMGGSEGSSSGSIGFSNPNSDSGSTVILARQDGSSQIWNQVVFYDTTNASDRMRATQLFAGETCVMNNCLIYDIDGGGSDIASGFYSVTAGNMVCNNCTAYDIDSPGTSAAFFGCETNGCYAGNADTTFAGTTSGNWNASSDTGASVFTNNLQNKAGSDCFENVTLGTEDFHPKSGSPLIDTGNDTANEADLDFGDGILTRDDFGCLEFVAAGGGVANPWYQYHQQQGGL